MREGRKEVERKGGEQKKIQLNENNLKINKEQCLDAKKKKKLSQSVQMGVAIVQQKFVTFIMFFLGKTVERAALLSMAGMTQDSMTSLRICQYYKIAYVDTLIVKISPKKERKPPKYEISRPTAINNRIITSNGRTEASNSQPPGQV